MINCRPGHPWSVAFPAKTTLLEHYI